MKAKGGGNLQSQIEKLEHELDGIKIEQAKRMAKSDPLMIRLAFKYLAKPHQKASLSKGQQNTYEQLLQINSDFAERWKTQRIAAK